MYEARQNKEKVSRTICFQKQKRVLIQKINDSKATPIQRYIAEFDYWNCNDDADKREIMSIIRVIGVTVDAASAALAQNELTHEEINIPAVKSLLKHWDKGTNTSMSAGTAIHQIVYNRLRKIYDKIKIEEKHIDILQTLDSGNKVVFDITSKKEAEKQHAKDRYYHNIDPHIVAVVEIGYEDYFAFPKQ